MKQYPTQKQWQSISKEVKEYFSTMAWWNRHKVTIGAMIEFLGDSLDSIDKYSMEDWHVAIKGRNECFTGYLMEALLEATIEKAEIILRPSAK